VEHFENIIKKLLMIVSRPARLLECLVSCVALLSISLCHRVRAVSAVSLKQQQISAPSTWLMSQR